MKNEISRELTKIRSDEAVFLQQEKKKMEEFSEELNNGLGEAIKNSLRSPDQGVVIHKGLKYNFKKWWRSIKENFKIMFYNINE